MFCPACGREQSSDVTRFCSGCGLPMDAIAEVAANGGSYTAGTAPRGLSRYLPTRGFGIKFGMTWLAFFGLLLAFVFDALKIRPWSDVFLAIGWGGGIAIMLFAWTFLPARKRKVLPGSVPTGGNSGLQGNVSWAGLETGSLETAKIDEAGLADKANILLEQKR